MPKCATNQILRDLETTDSEISDDAGDLGAKSVTGVSTNPLDAIGKASSTKVERIWRVLTRTAFKINFKTLEKNE
jgi:hypothetical protein